MNKLPFLFILFLFGNITLFAQNEADESEVAATPIDTLSTADKFKKVILYDDYTWEYLELERPDIDEDALMENWDNVAIHAYKDVEIASLPNQIELVLVDSTHSFCMPVHGFLSSRYGWRGKRPHRGIDIPLKIGDSVRSAFDGIVRVAEGSSRTGGYGNLIVVRHPNGLETYYGHLSQILVKENEVVSAGEVIGLGGSTGRSTGPHLHFETRYMGKAFDPERVVDVPGDSLRCDTLVIYKSYFDVNSRYTGKTTTAPVVQQTQTNNSTSSSSKVYYTVRKGDNLGKIAKKYHTTVSKLCKLNHISERTILQIGRKLRVK